MHNYNKILLFIVYQVVSHMHVRLQLVRARQPMIMHDIWKYAYVATNMYDRHVHMKI